MPANQRLTEALRHYTAAAQPVVSLLYENRPLEALEALEAELARISATELDEEVAEALQRRLDYLCYQVAKQAYPQDEPQDRFTKCVERLAAPARTPAGEMMRAIVLIELLAHASRLGLVVVEPEQMHDLLSKVPPEDRDPECWFYIAAWAFENNDLELLEQAYEVSLLNPTDFRDQYPFQRVKLMHRLLTGELQEVEIAAVVANMELLPEVLEFRRHIWPRIQSAGLGNPELAALLDAREAVLRAELDSAADDMQGQKEQSRVT